MANDALVATLIATFTLAGVAFGRVPGLPWGRAGFALVGALALVVTGVLDLERAVAIIDGEVLLLLFGLMLLAEALAEAGVFRMLLRVVGRRATHPWALLAVITFASGILSALFLNDTVVLMLTPLTIQLARSLRLSPLPYLLALATAANVGSVATLSGNPQNILVATGAGIGYLPFAAALTPVALIGLLVVLLVIGGVHRRALTTATRDVAHAASLADTDHSGTRQLVAAGWAVVLMGLFITGTPPALAALIAGTGAWLSGGRRSADLLRRVDLGLLVLFSGLFVVVGALVESSVVAELIASLGSELLGEPLPLTLMTAGASNLVSNVPAVMLLLPLLEAVEADRWQYLSVAMASTLAGNLTLVGSIANLIVAERARAEGVNLGFLSYLAVGVPITVLTLVLGAGWLSLWR
jgi:Na+/H+ antiporter NhaD/arsenite permease-like protein